MDFGGDIGLWQRKITEGDWLALHDELKPSRHWR